jgi:phi LC3 family holin
LYKLLPAPFGYNWDFANLGTQITGVINAVFAVLAIVGVAYDPTTDGLKDSLEAQQRTEPKKEDK